MNKISATPKTPKKYKKITASYLENAGAYYLQRFPASINQFRQVMQRKIYKSCRDHPEQDIENCASILENVINKFINLGYLNDKSYAHALLDTLNNRGYSHARIMQTLKHKGIDGDLIEEIMPKDQNFDDLQAAIRLCKRKKLGCFAIRIRENELQKSLSTLARAGFSYDCAKRALQLTIDEALRCVAD